MNIFGCIVGTSPDGATGRAKSGHTIALIEYVGGGDERTLHCGASACRRARSDFAMRYASVFAGSH